MLLHSWVCFERLDYIQYAQKAANFILKEMTTAEGRLFEVILVAKTGARHTLMITRFSFMGYSIYSKPW